MSDETEIDEIVEDFLPDEEDGVEMTATEQTPPAVEHYPTCTADYPEKVAGESPQMLSSQDIGNGETAWTCVDCGATVITKSANYVSVNALDDFDDPDALTIDIGEDAQRGLAYPTPCAFVTGVAGSGKSWTLRDRIEKDPDYAILSSSTGISAVNLGSTTINSLLGFFDTASLKDAYLHGTAQRKLRKLLEEGYRNVVIDECSMIARETLDLLVRVFDDTNDGRAAGTQPIGLIIVGDVCLAKGTKVMCYDGTLINCEDVQVGTRLMGPDFMPRTVTKTCFGTDELYKVKQTNGDEYTVNSRHRLALRRSVDGSRRDNGKNKNLLRYAQYPNEFAMPVTEVFSRSKKFRECFVGYKAGCIPFDSQNLLIEPYFFGLWLGDGDKDGPRLTTIEPEVMAYCGEYSERLGLTTSTHGWARTAAKRIRISAGAYSGKSNPLTVALRTYGVKNNKFIPDDYMYNSEQNRLNLLAGIIDSDGCWHGNRYTITLITEDLCKQIKQLADQLGFRSTIIKIKSSGATFGVAWSVSIGGDTWRIPCRVPRKRSLPRSLGRSRLTSVLSIKSVGIGEYAGFEVDGDHRFLLADGTVTYNCQLPPIADRPLGVPRARRGQAEKTPWLFESESWSRFADNTTRLTKIWRQDDPTFLAALNHARAGQGDPAVSALRAAGAEFANAVDVEFDGTTIVGTNEEAARINQLALDRITGRTLAIPARRWGRLRSEWSEKLIPDRTILKEGAYVTLLANRKLGLTEFEYVNGDCGKILSIHPSTEKGQPAMLEIELVRNGASVLVGPIVRHVDHREKPDGFSVEVSVASGEDVGRYIAKPHYRGKERKFVSGQIEYYPVRLAYASTCHRAQGLTLDRCQIDLRHWMWTRPAMAYVGVSRCKQAKNLRLIGMPEKIAKAFVCDPKVRPWL